MSTLTAVHRVRLADCPAQPWKNGGGVTRELLAWPPPDRARDADSRGDSGAAWRVRVSVADIGRDGPFSRFPGVDRCFAVLEGEGVELGLPQGPHQQRTTDPPLFFAGDSPIDCRLLNGPTRDLNVMAPRSTGRISLQRALPGEVLSPEPLWRGLFVFDAALVQWDDSLGPQHLDAGTLCWSSRMINDRETGHSPSGSNASWRLLSGNRAFWLALHPSPEYAA